MREDGSPFPHTCSWRGADVQGHFDFLEKQNRKCSYNVIFRRFRAITVAVKKQ
jgi:hypothetical protein